MRRYSNDSSAPRHLRRLVEAGKRDDLDPLRRARVAASLGLVPATAMAMPSRPPPSPTLPPASGGIVRTMPRTVLGGIVIASVAVLGAGSWVSREVVSRESATGETPSPPSIAANPSPVSPEGRDGREGQSKGEPTGPVPANRNATVHPIHAHLADGPSPSGEAKANSVLEAPSIDVSDLPPASANPNANATGAVAMTAPLNAQETAAHPAAAPQGRAEGRPEGRAVSVRAHDSVPSEPGVDARVARGSDKRAAARGSDGRISDKASPDPHKASANLGTSAASLDEKSGGLAPNGPGIGAAIAAGSGAPVGKATAKAGTKDPAKDPIKNVAKDAPNAGDLHEELAALDNVRRKTASGDPPAALALLDTYEKRFPTGKLREEALVLRIEALAANGQRESAERLAKTLFAASPNTPYASRVRAAIGRRSEEQ